MYKSLFASLPQMLSDIQSLLTERDAAIESSRNKQNKPPETLDKKSDRIVFKDIRVLRLVTHVFTRCYVAFIFISQPGVPTKRFINVGKMERDK